MNPADLSTILDLPCDVVIDGKAFTLHQLHLSDFGAAEAHIRASRLNQFIELTKQSLMDPAVRSSTMARIMCERIDFGEVLMSPTGRTYLLYRSLRRGDPTLRLEDIGEMEEVTFRILSDLVDLITGIKEQPPGEGESVPLAGPCSLSPKARTPTGVGSSESSAPNST